MFIPPSGSPPTEPDMWRWFSNLEAELPELDLTQVERESLCEYYREAGLLTPLRKRFFRRHFAATVAQSVAFLFRGRTQPCILDLGCGAGTQALLFALLGARVIGVDMDRTALATLEKRQRLYEYLSGRKLAITTFATDTVAFDYSSVGPLDGVFSLFAFNMMQPSAALVDRILTGCAADVRFCIVDGNNRSLLARTVPSRRRAVWSPQEFATEMQRRGFSIHDHHGGISIPPPVWNLAPSPLLNALDGWLNSNWFFPISHLIMAARTSG